MRRAARAVALLPLLAAGACQIVPRDGPTRQQVIEQADVRVKATAATASYAVVDLSPASINVANRFTQARNPAFSRRFMAGRRSYASVPIGVGDTVAVTVFEASAGGLFTPQEATSRAGNFVGIPNQQVDASGNITVPFAGAVAAAGRLPREVSDDIAGRLNKRAIEPQVVVSIVDRRGNSIGVLGEVNAPTRFALDPGGITVLGALARAGGPRNPAYESVVTVQRGDGITQAVLSAIVRDPRQNITLAPGDIVYVSREQRIFMAMGSTPSPGSIGGTNNRRFTFDNDNMTLAEAVSKAGGLDGARADAGAIFVLRYESRDALAAMGIDTSRYRDEAVPTIFRTDWTKADGFFKASDFYMRNKDIVYVAEHPVSDLSKFTSALRGLTGAAGDVAIATVR